MTSESLPDPEFAETRAFECAKSDGLPKIDNYQLVKMIGRGAMGEVWEAYQSRPIVRRVAIKVIRSDIGHDSDVTTRFEVERQALALMNHENIARVLDAGTCDNGSPYFVMDLVDGNYQINDYCDKFKLGLAERIGVFAKICDAVQHAHQQGIIHRDLKPSNILVDVSGKEPRAKIIDFGVAKALGHSKLTKQSLATQYGQVVGSLQYMSPEQANLKQSVDTRSDIYSLGVILYELLVGSPPIPEESYQNKNLPESLELIENYDPLTPSRRLSAVNEHTDEVTESRRQLWQKLQKIQRRELDWIVMKSLEKDRTRRYQTAINLADDLRRYLSGEAVLARPPSAVYKLEKFVVKNKGLFAAIVLVIVLLAFGILGMSYGLVQANRNVQLERNSKIAALERDTETFDLALETTKASIERYGVFAQRLIDRGDAFEAIQWYREILSMVQRKNNEIETRNESNEQIRDGYSKKEADLNEFKLLDEERWRRKLAALLNQFPYKEWVYQSGVPIESVRLSPSGTKVAFASERGYHGREITVWDLIRNVKVCENLKVGYSAASVPGQRFAYAWLPDRDKLIYATKNNYDSDSFEFVVFDADSAQEVARSEKLSGWPLEIIPHANESAVLCYTSTMTEGQNFGVLKSFSTVDFAEKKLAEFKGNLIKLNASTDQKILAVEFLSEKGVECKLFDRRNFQRPIHSSPDFDSKDEAVEIEQVQDSGRSRRMIALAPNGSSVAFRSSSSSIQLYQLRASKEVVSFEKEQDFPFFSGVDEIRFSPDSSLMAVMSSGRLSDGGSNSNKCSVFSLSMGTFDHHFQTKKPVHQLAFSTESTHLAVASQDGEITIFDLRSGIPRWPSFQVAGKPIGLHFASGNRLVVTTSSGVRCFNLKKNALNHRLSSDETQNNELKVPTKLRDDNYFHRILDPLHVTRDRRYFAGKMGKAFVDQRQTPAVSRIKFDLGRNRKPVDDLNVNFQVDDVVFSETADVGIILGGVISKESLIGDLLRSSDRIRTLGLASFISIAKNNFPFKFVLPLNYLEKVSNGRAVIVSFATETVTKDLNFDGPIAGFGFDTKREKVVFAVYDAARTQISFRIENLLSRETVDPGVEVGGRLSCVSFSGNLEKALMTLDTGDTVSVDLEHGVYEMLKRNDQTDLAVWSSKITSTGDFAAVVSPNIGIRLFNLNDGKELPALLHDRQNSNVVISTAIPGTDYIAFASNTGSMMLVDLRNGDELIDRQFSSRISGIAGSPAGNMLAITETTGQLHLIEIPSGAILRPALPLESESISNYPKFVSENTALVTNESHSGIVPVSIFEDTSTAELVGHSSWFTEDSPTNSAVKSPFVPGLHKNNSPLALFVELQRRVKNKNWSGARQLFKQIEEELILKELVLAVPEIVDAFAAKNDLETCKKLLFAVQNNETFLKQAPVSVFDKYARVAEFTNVGSALKFCDRYLRVHEFANNLESKVLARKQKILVQNGEQPAATDITRFLKHIESFEELYPLMVRAIRVPNCICMLAASDLNNEFKWKQVARVQLKRLSSLAKRTKAPEAISSYLVTATLFELPIEMEGLVAPHPAGMPFFFLAEAVYFYECGEPEKAVSVLAACCENFENRFHMENRNPITLAHLSLYRGYARISIGERESAKQDLLEAEEQWNSYLQSARELGVDLRALILEKTAYQSLRQKLLNEL